MTVFQEPLPIGALGVIRVAAFATVVLSAVWLAPKRPTAVADAQRESSEKPADGTSRRRPVRC